MKIEYSSNNSGGRWWLTDDHWRKLEAAGWTVRWVKDQEGFLGLRKDGRWLGALAKEAEKDFPDMGSAIREWEEITSLDASAEGCNCCGAPHSFRCEEPYQYVSGEDCLQFLFARVPSSLREATEILNRKT